MKDLARRHYLLDIGQRTGDGLTHFVNVQKSTPHSGDPKFNSAGFREQKEEGIRTKEYFGALLNELLQASEIPPESELEEDYTRTLGDYICAVIETTNAYIEHCEAFSQFDPSRRLKTIISIFSTRWRMRRKEKRYVRIGVQLTALWNIYNYAEPGEGCNG